MDFYILQKKNKENKKYRKIKKKQKPSSINDNHLISPEAVSTSYSAKVQCAVSIEQKGITFLY